MSYLYHAKFYRYGVATISRLLKMIGLFCKRALHRRLYSTKETHDFKEPTNRSHPIVSLPRKFHVYYHAHSTCTIMEILNVACSIVTKSILEVLSCKFYILYLYHAEFYRVAKTHRIPYLDRSFPAKVTYV